MTLQEELSILNRDGQLWYEYSERRQHFQKLEEEARARFQSAIKASPKLKKAYYAQFNPKPSL